MAAVFGREDKNDLSSGVDLVNDAVIAHAKREFTPMISNQRFSDPWLPGERFDFAKNFLRELPVRAMEGQEVFFSFPR